VVRSFFKWLVPCFPGLFFDPPCMRILVCCLIFAPVHFSQCGTDPHPPPPPWAPLSAGLAPLCFRPCFFTHAPDSDSRIPFHRAVAEFLWLIHPSTPFSFRGVVLGRETLSLPPPCVLPVPFPVPRAPQVPGFPPDSPDFVQSRCFW